MQGANGALKNVVYFSRLSKNVSNTMNLVSEFLSDVSKVYRKKLHVNVQLSLYSTFHVQIHFIVANWSKSMCKTKPLIHREPTDTEFIN